jgi:hypothetical protein
LALLQNKVPSTHMFRAERSRGGSGNGLSGDFWTVQDKRLSPFIL